jgi:hypothetical protein
MASKSIVPDDALVGALQRFASAQGCCWLVMTLRGDELKLAVENSGEFEGFRSAVQMLDGSGGGATSTAFALLKVNLSEAKGGLAVDSLGRQKTVFFTCVPEAAPAFERASTSEAKSAVRAALGVVVHVEYTVENAGDIEEAAVLTRVKQSTGGGPPVLQPVCLQPCSTRRVCSLVQPSRPANSFVSHCSFLRLRRSGSGPGAQRASPSTLNPKKP